MDRFSELEVKYNAPGVTITAFEAAFSKKMIRRVVGTDTYYVDPVRNVLRYRRGENETVPALTYKRRKNGGDSVDRVEVDLYLNLERATEVDVKTFLEKLGYIPHFTITKESHIVKVKDLVAEGAGTEALVVVALYDVLSPAGGLFRYLEIEIDKSSNCKEFEARDVLRGWSKELETKLRLDKPLGTSLYEIHAPRNELYVPDSF